MDTDNDNAISFSEFERIMYFEMEFYKYVNTIKIRIEDDYYLFCF